MTRQKEQEDQAEKTRQEIEKGNQMTALRFQTGGGHQTSPASLRGVCGKVVGERQEQLSQLYERRVVRKAKVIVDDNSHVLAKHYNLLPSG